MRFFSDIEVWSTIQNISKFQLQGLNLLDSRIFFGFGIYSSSLQVIKLGILAQDFNLQQQTIFSFYHKVWKQSENSLNKTWKTIDL